MRILFISHTAEWTGPTNSLIHLTRHLSGRFEVEVLYPGEGPLGDALEREGIVRRSLPSLDRHRIFELRRLIRRGGYRLVYGNNTSSGCRNALIAARLARVPFVCHVRGMAEPGQWRKFGFLRFAHAVIAVSEACARAVERYSGRERLHVVHNGVELPPKGPGGPRPDPPLQPLPEDVRLLLSVAHVCPRKGQHHAVEAMARVVGEVPSAHLLLVGALDRDPAYVEELRGAIAAYDLERNVSILGFREDVSALLGVSELFLHAATHDPHPRALIEAMAAELPVVAFGVDGVAETVRHGRTGLLCPAGDVPRLSAAILELLRDPARRAAFGRAGRARVADRFSADATAREVERILRRTLERTTGDTLPDPGPTAASIGAEGRDPAEAGAR